MRHHKPISDYAIRVTIVWVMLAALLTTVLMLKMKRTFITLMSPLLLFVCVLLAQIFTEYNTAARKAQPPWAHSIVNLHKSGHVAIVGRVKES